MSSSVSPDKSLSGFPSQSCHGVHSTIGIVHVDVKAVFLGPLYCNGYAAQILWEGMSQS